MLEAFVVALREGIEAALVVGLVVTFLRREGTPAHLRAVWAGVAAALVASVAGAWVLYSVAINQEAFEGILYLVSAVLVASLVVWMWRHAPALAGEVRGRLSAILEQESTGRPSRVTLGLFVFTFFMVVREGIETVAFLAAVSISSGALQAWIGAAVGLAVAVAFGVMFVRGAVRIDLQRFFRVTGVALLILVVQLLLNSYHELSEAGWVPASATTMAVVGPLVRNDVFFILGLIAIPLLALVIPPTRRPGDAPVAESNPAAARLRRAEELRARRARFATAALGLVAVAALGMDRAYSQPVDTLPEPTMLALSGDSVRIPGADLETGMMRRYAAEVDGLPVRFIAIRRGDGTVATALDACLICGDKGYLQDGEAITCRHCHSAIYVPSIGNAGGCNPIPLASTLDGGDVLIARAALVDAVPSFRH